MSKRKANQTDVDDLIESLNSSLVLDNNEYDLLMTAFESNITDEDIISIIQASARRYVRYLRAEIFQDYQYIESKINLYLQKYDNTTTTTTSSLEKTFKGMKEIDGLIIAAIDGEVRRKRQRKDRDSESESEYDEFDSDSMHID